MTTIDFVVGDASSGATRRSTTERLFLGDCDDTSKLGFDDYES